MKDNRYDEGIEIRKSLGVYGEDGLAGSYTEFEDIAPNHSKSIVEYCFGTCWNQGLLDHKTREMLIVAAAAAQDLPEEVETHTRGLMNQGVASAEVVEAIVSLCPYIGFPKTNHALRAAKKAIESS